MLTGLLIDMLKSSSPSRIVNVSSTGHKGLELIFNSLNIVKFFLPKSTFISEVKNEFGVKPFFYFKVITFCDHSNKRQK